jgi:SHS2 domain-containing protein
MAGTDTFFSARARPLADELRHRHISFDSPISSLARVKIMTSPEPAATQPMQRYELFAHGADIGVRGRGASKVAAFAEAARAMTAVLTDPDKVKAETRVSVSCEAPDDELLLLEWLNAVVFEMATRDMLFSRFEVAIEDHRLSADLWGEALDRARHEPSVEIKGATLTTLKVGREADGGWVAQTVVDV